MNFYCFDSRTILHLKKKKKWIGQFSERIILKENEVMNNSKYLQFYGLILNYIVVVETHA